ncbi:excisionase family DNA-binding protein [Anaerolineales bacterium HSG25]|nr:excisionase family DNA-binding protein [Anaerolineales bacterium HSG25]
MTLDRYFKIAFRWWWLVFIAVTLSATTSYIYSKRLPKIYMARSVVQIGNFAGEVNPDTRTLQLNLTLAEVYAERVKQAKITQGVIQRHNLSSTLTSGQLGGMIVANINPKAQLLDIQVSDIEPKRVAFLANALADELVLQSPAQAQQDDEAFTREKLDRIETKVNAITRAIEENQTIVDEDESAVNREEARALINELERQEQEQLTIYYGLYANLNSASPNKIEVFEYADAPASPVGPNVRNNVVAAGIVGLILAIAGIIVIEFFDDTLVWQEGVSSINEVSVLGTIGKATAGDSKIITHDKLWSPEASALRDLRESIFLTAGDRSLSTLLITSPLAGAGKTYLTANLGVTVATSKSTILAGDDSADKNIILVDADLRKPTLHEIFDIPNVVGLSDVLVSPAEAIESVLKQAIRPTYLDNLFLLPAGRKLADPGSLLNSIQFIDIINYLKDRSQFVIIDSAPILEAVETKAIDNIVDGTVLVINNGRTRQRVVNLAVDYFSSKKKNTFLGLIFNRVKLAYGQEYHSAQAAQSEQFERSFMGWKFWSSKKRQKTQSTLTLSEAAIHLGVKEETVRRWCETGRIQGIKTGSRWKVRLEDLEEYITFYKLNNRGVEKVLKKQPIAQNGASTIRTEPTGQFDELPATIDDDDPIL